MTLTVSILAAVCRWALALAGMSEMMSADEQMQLVGALASVLSLAWSVWQKVQTHRREQRR
jgi:hypothetical protein